ncbi:Ferric iron ABC transporter, iron-binding protein [hydrothermal vent metagenome]|uniref:Ferric iron ABC transporter, iron-binding protein n=1 Tax=hydrothermal vent metagenome TaxID=652676 RepID=A0A3B1DI17_9ZZZZ
MIKIFRVIIFLSLCWMIVIGNANANELVVFSGRKEPLIRPVIDLFEKEFGIKVILKTGKSAALGQQILQELPSPSADIYIAKESGSLEYLRIKGAFEIYKNNLIENIPEKFRARDGSWVGVSGRSRALLINTELINREAAPKTLIDLLDPKWKGKIAAVNMSNESLVAWVSGLCIALGNMETERILKGLKSNQIQLITKSHTDIRKAVARGEFSMGLINHYYYHLQKKDADSDLRYVDIIYLDQGPGQRGELVNVSGAAIVKGAKNRENAKKFMNFLVSELAQKLFAGVNFEYPLLPSVATNPDVLSSMHCEGPSAIECLRVMDVNLDELGAQLDSTMELLERIDWR